ncbi:NAD(P)-dependent oxidoreductase [Catellatospora tritici]|uniref:NAD(P)-dependent oxidoreductase n=1 Tax=Catellatospora tritici TaxID=2851566 RepID=UPI001C2CCC2C|nr:NAD(P)-binding oxidoreductase [Catellatospora tritici]MBV1856497.1 SDR family oxidoreductase [Catellatospora tritici]
MSTRITVLGTTGRVGALVTRQALDRGWLVTALVRDAARLPAELLGRGGLRVVVGQVDDPAAVAEATTPAPDAVVVAAGVRYRRGHPWSGVDGRSDVVPAAVGTLLGVVPPTTRLVLLSAVGVGESWQRLPWIARAVTATSSLPTAYRELGEAERMLAAAAHPTTVIRAVTLTDDPGSGRPVDATGRPLRGNPKVARTDVAAMLLNRAAEPHRDSRVLVAAA